MLIHSLFSANSPVINAIIKKLSNSETKTVFATTEFEPDP